MAQENTTLSFINNSMHISYTKDTTQSRFAIELLQSRYGDAT